MSFYSEMADMANELLSPDAQGGLGQGLVQIKRISLGEAPNEYSPAPEVETSWTLKAAVKRLHQRYENGVLIIETGDQIIAGTMASLTKLAGEDVAPVEQAFAPQNGDILVIDGLDRAIDNITPIPGAGTVSAWKLWSKA
jgi:hypothetical protein